MPQKSTKKQLVGYFNLLEELVYAQSCSYYVNVKIVN